jgi:hypothetical protein
MSFAQAVLSLFLVRFVWCSPGVNTQIAQLEKENSPLLRYPTSFTQNIVPKAIHSHNDCDGFPNRLRLNLTVTS